MSEIPEPSDHFISQTRFQKLTDLVSTEFQIEEALIHQNIPTYYLSQRQETKQPFLRLLKKLETMNLVPLLREKNERTILKIVPKPHRKPSNILINWVLFFVTIATTFTTGYILSLRILNPWIGGLSFSIAIIMVLGTHELGHKLTADRRNIEATPPYFIPAPPPIFGIFGIGTFGAVIKQKSLPPNKDALFDVGSMGPLVGFIIATIVTAVGFMLTIPISPIEGLGRLPLEPVLWTLIHRGLSFFGLMPEAPPGKELVLHPVALAGWVGMVITMLNLLPAAMLDGGHIARSVASEKIRKILTTLSILWLILQGFWPMAFFVLFLSMRRHPGPLDDVSSLSTGRKLLTIVLVAIFVLCSSSRISFI